MSDAPSARTRDLLVTAARSTVLGLAIGGRVSAALAALSTSSGRRDPGWLGLPAVRIGAAVAAVGEGIGDQLPSTPSRLEPTGLASRLVAGGGAGFLLARRYGGGRTGAVSATLAGVGGALAGSYVGAQWRKEASERWGTDRPGAVIEDVVVIGLAVGATQIKR